MIQVPLLQTLQGALDGARTQINGFPLDLLAHVGSGSDGQVRGLSLPMAGYAVIHPYFLRNGAGNELLAAAGGAAAVAQLRVAALALKPGAELGTRFADRELLRGEAAPRFSGSFAWSGLPEWAWTRARPAADDAATRQGVLAAAQRLWQQLDGLAGKPVPAQLLNGSRATVQDFARASALGGKPYTAVDELLAVASALRLPRDRSPEEFLTEAAQRAREGQPQEEDAPSPHPPVARRADGSLPPRLSLHPLDGELRLQLLAGGRLARLVDRSGQPAIRFVSNYHDGPRGSPHEVRYSADPWFRRHAAGQWELDALYPPVPAPLSNRWPQEVLESLSY